MRFSLQFFAIALLFASSVLAQQNTGPSIKVTFEAMAPRPIPRASGETEKAMAKGPLNQFATVQFVEPSEVAAGLNSNRATFPIPRPQFDETAYIHAEARLQRESLANCPQRTKCCQDLSQCHDEWAGFCNPKRLDWECDCDPFPRPEKTMAGCGVGGCGRTGCGHSRCRSSNGDCKPGVLKVNISLGKRYESVNENADCQCDDCKTHCQKQSPVRQCRQVQPIQKVKAMASRVNQRCKCVECECGKVGNDVEEVPRPEFEDTTDCQCQNGCRCTAQNHCGCKN